MKKQKQLISICTPTFNSEKYLEKTIKSVINQGYNNIQFIIIDGGSTDKTLKIIKKYRKHIDYWVSKKDKGIYDAWNKGLKVAKGEVFGILSSDDYYYSNTFSIVNNYFIKHPKINFLFGATRMRWGITHKYKPEKIKWSFGFYTTATPGFFIKTKDAKKIGGWSLKYKTSSDYDFFYKMLTKYNMKGMIAKKKEIFGYRRSGGFSSNVPYLKWIKECTKIRLDNGQNPIYVYIIHLIRIFKNLDKVFQ
jgi:glycosyltransferase involved in cell wall biosynthesis